MVNRRWIGRRTAAFAFCGILGATYASRSLSAAMRSIGAFSNSSQTLEDARSFTMVSGRSALAMTSTENGFNFANSPRWT